MNHGRLGQHQRPYERAGALSLVQTGARPYSPLLGRFLSVDPAAGGFDYVNDLDGKWAPRIWGGVKASWGSEELRPVLPPLGPVIVLVIL